MIQKAFLFAYDVHKNQQRKDDKPYISHPFSVAIELAKNGADDELICAGLLHDVVEDAGVTRETVAEKFGSRVAELVAEDSEDKSLSWERRKQNTLDKLKNGADRSVCMLVCADKLSNIRDIAEQLDNGNTEIWNDFKRGKDKQEWLYRETLGALSSIDDLKMYEDLKFLTDRVFDENKGE